MTGAGKVMIDQSTGMMVQDLQSFLKGFEQVGLIALSRLANNFLTYGTPSENKPPPKKKLTEGAAEETETETGNEMMRDLFKIVSDYAEVKTKISTAIFAANASLKYCYHGFTESRVNSLTRIWLKSAFASLLESIRKNFRRSSSMPA